MSLVSCTGYAVLTLMRVGFCRPGSSRPGGGCHAPAPGRRSEGLPRCDYRGGGSLASNPGPQANPLTEVVREVLTSSRAANAFCTPCAGASASYMHWLGYCASLMLSFLPTRTARSTNIKEKDSDVVTDGTVGWRRRNGKDAALASREFASVGHHHHWREGVSCRVCSVVVIFAASFVCGAPTVPFNPQF